MSKKPLADVVKEIETSGGVPSFGPSDLDLYAHLNIPGLSATTSRQGGRGQSIIGGMPGLQPTNSQLRQTPSNVLEGLLPTSSLLPGANYSTEAYLQDAVPSLQKTASRRSMRI